MLQCIQCIQCYIYSRILMFILKFFNTHRGHAQFSGGLFHLSGGVHGNGSGHDDVLVQRVDFLVILHAFVLQDLSRSLDFIGQFGRLYVKENVESYNI